MDRWKKNFFHYSIFRKNFQKKFKTGVQNRGGYFVIEGRSEEKASARKNKHTKHKFEDQVVATQQRDIDE